ncbi:MAG: hypothetical protein AAFV71_19565 [Cyanobacteria bacterium J06633_8]
MSKFTAVKTTESKQVKTSNTLLTDVEQIPAIDQDGRINGVISAIDRVKDKNRETGKETKKFKFTIQVLDEDGEEMKVYLRTNCRITGKKFKYKDDSMKYSKLVRFLQALEVVPEKINEEDSFQFDLTQLIDEPISFKLYEENGFWTPDEDSFSFVDEDEEDSGEE